MQSAQRQVSKNTRFLMWRRGVPREEWATWLERRVGWRPSLIVRLVHDDVEDSRLGEAEVAELSTLFGMNGEEQEIRYRDLATEHGEVLHENLTYLINSLERGGKKSLAEAVGIDPTTISRWLNGSFAPHKTTLQALSSYFGLPPGTDLEADPMFLSAEPMAQSEQRRWLKERMDQLSTEEFRQLYPALRRMLGER